MIARVKAGVESDTDARFLQHRENPAGSRNLGHRRVGLVEPDRASHEISVDRVHPIAQPIAERRLARSRCESLQAWVDPSRRSTAAGVTSSPAARRASRRHRLTVVVVTHCCAGHIEDDELDRVHHLCSRVQESTLASPSSCATTRSARPNDSVIPAPPTPVMAVTPGAGWMTR